jgi:hypothetical protein
MNWEDQGRQEHGWFGSGTSPNGSANDIPRPLGHLAELGEHISHHRLARRQVTPIWHLARIAAQ